MHLTKLIFTSFVFVALALAQQPPVQNTRTFTSSAAIQGMIAKAEKTRKVDQPMLAQPILQFAPYTASLEYRATVGPAAVHETEAEMFYVVDGAGTLVTGGKLESEKRTNASNLSGSGIRGGQSQALSKGDFAVVPEDTPHWFGHIEGRLVLMSIHLPRDTRGK